MNLEDIMLQEISQPQKASTVGSYSQEMSRRGKFRDRKLMHGCRAGGGQGVMANGHGVSFVGDKNILELRQWRQSHSSVNIQC